jgi:hypothetical protein
MVTQGGACAVMTAVGLDRAILLDDFYEACPPRTARTKRTRATATQALVLGVVKTTQCTGYRSTSPCPTAHPEGITSLRGYRKT